MLVLAVIQEIGWERTLAALEVNVQDEITAGKLKGEGTDAWDHVGLALEECGEIVRTRIGGGS